MRPYLVRVVVAHGIRACTLRNFTCLGIPCPFLTLTLTELFPEMKDSKIPVKI